MLLKTALSFRYLLLFPLIILPLSACGGGSGEGAAAPTQPTVIEVTHEVQLAETKRLGVNLGSYSRFADAGVLKNVITNPGFEAGEIAMIFLTDSGSQLDRISADNWETKWNRDDLNIGQPIDFWNGADYEVLSGNSKGRSGTVRDFSHMDNRYLFFLADKGSFINTGDAVLVKKSLAGYEGDTQAFHYADTGTIRPGSPGQQSLVLLPTKNNWQASFNYYMDSFWRDSDRSAGKLMPMAGRWKVTIWAKAEDENNTLNIRLRRQGESTFFNETIDLNQDWQLIEREFTIAPDADRYLDEKQQANILDFHLKIASDGGKVWVDDLKLERLDQKNPTVFSDIFVEQLQQLQLGVLRNWGSQLGSSLDNQLAEPWARKTTAYQPRHRIARAFHYSLPEFLQLAAYLQVEPWYVIPPTFSAVELQQLMAYLAAPAGSHPYADKRAKQGQIAPWTSVFKTIHLEYGNEMWGSNEGKDPFIGASLRGGQRLGEVAHDRFNKLKASPYFQANKFNLIIGGQSQFTGRQSEIESNSQAHNSIAIAPYFGILNQYATDEERYYPLFARAMADIQAGGRVYDSQIKMNQVNPATSLAIYEINFHTISGDAPLDIRNDFVTGLNGGLALPLYMLNYQKYLGITTQTAFQTLQYSFKMSNGDYVHLWGLLRDLEATGRKRPTGLGLALANRAIGGQLLVTKHSEHQPTWKQAAFNDIKTEIDLPLIHSFAFRDGDSYRLMLFNLHLYQAQTIELHLPTAVKNQATLHTLSAPSIHDDNESVESVQLSTQALNQFASHYQMTLAPHSAYVLEWQAQP
ncbi:hypothetical protein [Thioflexithrix psekupsensis]|uniref:Uncharacterized protein n=1 Tax=Thioflexithrix psekupsensis TaxID=1570016 RepID=A0A251XC72_9GAMM|nr:hypothetical protein [Thioflexithrix psekupsensis]OUD16254.1 hypothetical protein TPSD3_00585 [Thioflexithrix psekupsensis]